MAPDRLVLAGSDVQIPRLGVGAWSWGDKSTWGMGGYDREFTRASIENAWEASIASGAAFFDTAEAYGGGESERIIGELLANHPGQRSDVVLATKFMPSPWKLNVRRAVISAARGSIERMGIEAIDLYQIHGPVSMRSHSAMADALAGAHSEGLIRAIGVSNYSAREMTSIDSELRKRDLRLATNQIEFSLGRRKPETSGLLECCSNLGVIPLAYSPLGQGRFTGKYSAANPPPRGRNFSKHSMELIDPIVAELRRIGITHGDRTPGQVALNWIIAKGAVPIPGAKNRAQAQSNAGALGWSLDGDDVAALDAVALEGRGGVQAIFWQHG